MPTRSPVASTAEVVCVGTIAVSDPQAGLAVIGDSAHTASLHAVRSEILPGIVLSAVYPDHVVIERNGQPENLALPWRSTAFGGTTAGPARVATPRRLTGTGAIPVMARAPRSSAVTGVEVFSGRDRTAFARLGLRPGDIVTAINGSGVGQRAIDLLALLSGSDTATISVYRAGQMQQIRVRSVPPVNLSTEHANRDAQTEP